MLNYRQLKKVSRSALYVVGLKLAFRLKAYLESSQTSKVELFKVNS